MYVFYIRILGSDDVCRSHISCLCCAFMCTTIILHIQVDVCEYTLFTIHFCLFGLKMNVYNCSR